MKNFILLFILFPATALGQFSVSGIVSDANSNEPLIGATVKVENTFLVAVTDKKGNFTFRNLKTADYNIHVSYIGYQTISKKITVDGDKSIDFKLKSQILDRDAVVVEAIRADANSGMAFTKMDKEEISKNNLGQDIPYILSMQPSVVSTSDAGTGIGYTGIRIRGTDASRINVTLNGIPLNDAESQQLYWVDLPDLATSLDNIQVTRGVGTSTNGSGAFGASIDLQTSKLNATPFGEVTLGGGSFNTFKRNFKAGTGLINNHFAFEARLSKITSDGYVDRATSDLSSFFITGGYYGNKTSLRMNVISGNEKTYQAWNGVPESRIDNNVQGMQDFIDRNYLSNADAENLLESGRTYNYFTYKNQTDNYKQNHYQVFLTQTIHKYLNLNVAGFLTHGAGYYEEYKTDASYSDYNMTEPVINTDTIFTTDLIRQKWLDNNFYGGVFSLQYDAQKKLKVIFGGGYYQYDGSHFGKVIWAQYMGNYQQGHEYYNDHALKNDGNIYAKLHYAFTEKLTAFADVQYRHVDYHFEGFDASLNYIPQSVNLNFFNPKAGIAFQINDKQNVYASFSVGNHEPSRDDYVNSSALTRPQAETLYDVEAGYRFVNRKFTAGINYYLMLYKNQLVLTGKVNDVGEYTRTNASKSYRTGIELDAGYQILQNLSVKANITFSENKINSFDEYFDDYDNGGQIKNHYSNTDIAFSPSVIANGIVRFSPFRNFETDVIAKFVGEQFLDNTSNNTRTINSFSNFDLRIRYGLDLKRKKNTIAGKDALQGRAEVVDGDNGHNGIRLEFNFAVMNLLNRNYESNGYTYSYYYDAKTITENFYYPQAGINFLGQVLLRF